MVSVPWSWPFVLKSADRPARSRSWDVADRWDSGTASRPVPADDAGPEVALWAAVDMSRAIRDELAHVERLLATAATAHQHRQRDETASALQSLAESVVALRRTMALCVELNERAAGQARQFTAAAQDLGV